MVAIAAMFIEVCRELKLSRYYRLTASTHRELESVCRGGEISRYGPGRGNGRPRTARTGLGSLSRGDGREVRVRRSTSLAAR